VSKSISKVGVKFENISIRTLRVTKAFGDLAKNVSKEMYIILNDTFFNQKTNIGITL